MKPQIIFIYILYIVCCSFTESLGNYTITNNVKYISMIFHNLSFTRHSFMLNFEKRISHWIKIINIFPYIISSYSLERRIVFSFLKTFIITALRLSQL